MSILKIFIGCSNQAKVDKVIGKSKKRRSRFYRPLWWCVYCTSSSLTVFDLHSIACVDCDEIRHEVESYSTFKLLRNAFTRHSGKRIVSNRNDSGFKLNTSKHNISLMIHFRLPWGEPWSDHHQNRRRSVWDRPPSLEEMHHEQTDRQTANLVSPPLLRGRYINATSTCLWVCVCVWYTARPASQHCTWPHKKTTLKWSSYFLTTELTSTSPHRSVVTAACVDTLNYSSLANCQISCLWPVS